jgi:hypothetical protein
VQGCAPTTIGHNLLLRLASRKQDVLRFLADPNDGATKNACFERHSQW